MMLPCTAEDKQVLLAVDIGNSTIASAFFHEGAGEPEALERLPSGPAPAADGYRAAFQRFLAGRNGVTAAVSSVVPHLTGPVMDILETLCGAKPLLVTSDRYHLLPVTIPGSRAAQIGTDFVCSAVEAYSRFRSPCVIVDFGTALTFAAVSAGGALLGTAIAPGLAAAAQSLADSAARLSLVPIEIPASPLGQNTVQAIQSGLVYGWAGIAASLGGRFIAELRLRDGAREEDIAVIATGGFCELIAPLAGIFTHVDRGLVLKGLARIAAINGGAGAPAAV
jgi:type III pantothenate kinase